MIVSFLGCMLFTPIWGITGAAIGNLLGTASVYPPMMFFLRKKIDAKVIPYLKPIVILCVWAALLLLLKPISLMVKSGSIVVFLFACMLLSVVTKNDLKLLLSETGLSKWGPIRKFFAPGGGE
jgi:O-antigen/teichoic acid export membrane protein